MDIILTLCDEFRLKSWQVENVVKLIDEGNTIPFIARYRKEAHGTLDDQTLRAVNDRLDYLRNLDKRREEIFSSIEKQEKMTEEIASAIENAKTLVELEDIYRPFKQKRKTRASVAKEKGLEPLALDILEQAEDFPAPIEEAEKYVDTEKGVETAEDALKGAMDIIAEIISDNAEIRKRLRNLFTVCGKIITTATDENAESPYTQYYDYNEPVEKIADHRVLAIDRAEREGFIKVKLELDIAKAHGVINKIYLKNGNSLATDVVREAGADAYSRLIEPSVQREIRNILTEKADVSAIKNFSMNLKQLLLQPPVKGKTVLGLDPGYRTGCKVAVVDSTGRVLDTGVIYITHSEAQKESAKLTIKSLITKHNVDVVSIGNGTASKETAFFVSR